MIEDQLATVIDAAIADGTIALSVYSQNAFKLIVYRYDDTKLISNKTFDLEGEVTALSTATFSFGTYVLVGLSQRDSSSLVIFTVNWDELEGQPLASIQRGKKPKPYARRYSVAYSRFTRAGKIDVEGGQRRGLHGTQCCD